MLFTDKVLQGGEFFTNYVVPFNKNNQLAILFHKLKPLKTLCDIFVDLFGQYLIAVQGKSYGKCIIQRSSIESYNETLATELYDWTKLTFQTLGYL